MKIPVFSSSPWSLLAIAAGLTFSMAVAAQEAYTTKAVNVRAGPDRGYPLVVWVPGGSTVYVNGCLSDYRWCDVTAGADRGWVYAKNLQYTYQGRPMTIYGNGPTLALPIISFILGSYWNDNYRNRPWYDSQNSWNSWRPGNRPPPGFRPQPQPRPPIIRPDRPRPPQIQPPRPTRPPGTRPSIPERPVLGQPNPVRPSNPGRPAGGQPSPERPVLGQPNPRPQPVPMPKNNGDRSMGPGGGNPQRP
jgi:uncharacterized protein YraI